MKIFVFFSILIAGLLTCRSVFGQELSVDSLPTIVLFEEIPEYPENISAANILTRMIDGLGYRYYWATEGLNDETVSYVPGENMRSISETMEHVFDLSQVVLNAVSGQANVRPRPEHNHTWVENRQKTLENLYAARELSLNKKDKDVEAFKIIFQRGDEQADFPIWNLINGPIADAIYHTGQIVAFRRAAGNPVSPDMNVFSGKKRN